MHPPSLGLSRAVHSACACCRRCSLLHSWKWRALAHTPQCELWRSQPTAWRRPPALTIHWHCWRRSRAGQTGGASVGRRPKHSIRVCGVVVEARGCGCDGTPRRRDACDGAVHAGASSFIVCPSGGGSFAYRASSLSCGGLGFSVQRAAPPLKKDGRQHALSWTVHEKGGGVLQASGSHLRNSQQTMILRRRLVFRSVSALVLDIASHFLRRVGCFVNICMIHDLLRRRSRLFSVQWTWCVQPDAQHLLKLLDNAFVCRCC